MKAKNGELSLDASIRASSTGARHLHLFYGPGTYNGVQETWMVNGIILHVYWQVNGQYVSPKDEVYRECREIISQLADDLIEAKRNNRATTHKIVELAGK